MHAFLFVGEKNTAIEVQKLSEKLKAQILEYPIAKIEDVRRLGTFLRLAVNEPTIIYIKDIDKATTESLNAFLKNLEEPQKNIFFALTARSARKVLPTIVSRCQIIYVKGEAHEIDENAKKFLEMGVGERLKFIDKIKDRLQAQEFVEGLIIFGHSSLHTNYKNYKNMAVNLEIISETLSNLKANGQVSLQLTQMVVNLK